MAIFIMARVALNKGLSTVVAISALGADPDSRFNYNRGKGEMERDLAKLGFANYYFCTTSSYRW